MRDDLPAWRSLLFVPVTAEKFVRTCADRGADGIILDLEDSVAPSQKDHARTLIADAIPQVSRNGADVLVRVNRPWRLLVRDLEAAVIPGVAALMLTKVDSPEHVHACAEIVAELEAERDKLIARIAELEDEVTALSGLTEEVEGRLDGAIGEIHAALAR